MKKTIAFVVFLFAGFALYAESAQEVTIYTLPGCGRCAFTLKYMKKNQIKYTEYSVSDEANNSKMWGIIQSTGKFKGGSVSMPVVIIKGEVYFNIPDLQKFADSIQAKIGGEGSEKKDDEEKTSSSDSFSDVITERHNYHRKNHSAPNLKWNSAVAKVAQAWANKIASEDRMYHRQPNKYGENIYWVSGGKLDVNSVVDSWYSEISDYNFKKPGFKSGTGHFTQVVWVGSTEVGCGQAKSESGGTYVVCNYNPAGNYQGQFDKNVLPFSKSGGKTDKGMGNSSLPESLEVWVKGNSVSIQPAQGWTKKTLVIANHYKGKNNGVYIAVYSRNKKGSVYSVGGGIYVMGLIRVKGSWEGSIAIPEGFEGQDISAVDEFKDLANQYFPAVRGRGWVGGDTGGFFGQQNQEEQEEGESEE